MSSCRPVGPSLFLYRCKPNAWCREVYLVRGNACGPSSERAAICAAITSAAGLEASLKAIQAHDAEVGDGRRQVELALEQARYESNRAQRQSDSVDPETRIVAAEWSDGGTNACW
jgi:hypothetical protein